MKKNNFLIFTFFLFVLLSCNQKGPTEDNNKNEILQNKYFTAIIIEENDISCHLPLIQFIDDTSGIYIIFADSDTNKFEYEKYIDHAYSKFGFGPYLILGLPDSLNNLHDTIKIRFRKPYKLLDSNEAIVCNTSGPWFRLLIVKSLK